MSNEKIFRFDGGLKVVVQDGHISSSRSIVVIDSTSGMELKVNMTLEAYLMNLCSISCTTFKEMTEALAPDSEELRIAKKILDESNSDDKNL